MSHHWQCIGDDKDAGGGYYQGAEYTGQVCANWWEYDETIPVTLIAQDAYEEETGAAGYYAGEQAKALIGVDNAAAAGELKEIAEGDEAVQLSAVHTMCIAGTKRIVFMVNGALEKAVFLGPCSEVDEEYTPPGPNGDEGLARIEGKVEVVDNTVDHIAAQQDAESETLSETKTLAEQIKALAEGLGESVADVAAAVANLGDGEEPGEPGEGVYPTACGGEGNPCYTQQFPNGLGQAFEDANAQVQNGQVPTWMNGIMPTLPTEVPQCLSLQFTVPVFHWQVDFSPPCLFWDFAKYMLLLSTLFSVYGIMFGRG